MNHPNSPYRQITITEDASARLDRLERDLAETRRELARFMRDTAWMRAAADITPMKPTSDAMLIGEPLDIALAYLMDATEATA
jgi:hypothetical protein